VVDGVDGASLRASPKEVLAGAWCEVADCDAANVSGPMKGDAVIDDCEEV